MTTKLAAPTVLKKIFDRKTEEVAERKQRRSLAELDPFLALALVDITVNRREEDY